MRGVTNEVCGQTSFVTPSGGYGNFRFRVLVLAGVPELEETLRERAEDVFSRFKVLRLLPVSADDFKSCMADDFEPDAVDLIYGASDGNMRIFEEFCDDCRDKAMETGADKVTVDIALQFIEK